MRKLKPPIKIHSQKLPLTYLRNGKSSRAKTNVTILKTPCIHQAAVLGISCIIQETLLVADAVLAKQFPRLWLCFGWLPKVTYFTVLVFLAEFRRDQKLQDCDDEWCSFRNE